MMMFAGWTLPAGWLPCDGRLLSPLQYPALFAVLSNTYGGDGLSTFALPDLRGRLPLGAGTPNVPNAKPVDLGQQGGSASVTLSPDQLPAHTHALLVSTAPATSITPAGNVLATPVAADGTPVAAYGPATDLVAASPASIAPTGAGQPVPVMPPYVTLTYIICTEGWYPVPE
jgi:microcystin-dependent protein